MQKSKARLCLELFLTFFKIGAFTFGGGYAMLPVISRETAEKRGWVSEADIFDIIAVAESTPGPISINAATFIGRKTAGFFGALCATLGTVLPSFIIISVLSYFLAEFENAKLVRYAFFGIRAGVVALMVKALLSMTKQCPKDIFSLILAAAAFVCATFIDISAIWLILACALLGLAAALISSESNKGDKSK